MIPIKIQDDYWLGTKCIENEMPWLTPGSIYRLDELCKPTDTVLEVGSGGSTFFFARRCKHIVSVETDKPCFNSIADILAMRGVENVTYRYHTGQRSIELLFGIMTANGTVSFDIISIDSVHGFNRSSFLQMALNYNPKVSVIVLDNYGDQILFPEHFDKSIMQMLELCPGGPANWRGWDFNDPHWCGYGTRILTRRDVQVSV